MARPQQKQDGTTYYRRCVKCDWSESALSEDLFSHVKAHHKPHALAYYEGSYRTPARSSSWRRGKSPGSSRSGWY